MPPKRKRGGASKAPSKPVKTVNAKKPDVKKPFVPKFTEIMTRSKRRGKKEDVNETEQLNDTSENSEGIDVNSLECTLPKLDESSVEDSISDESPDKAELEESQDNLEESQDNLEESQDNSEGSSDKSPEFEEGSNKSQEIEKIADKSHELESIESQESKNENLISIEESIIMDVDDSQDEFDTQEQEAIISEQLTNLELEMSKVEVIKPQSLDAVEDLNVEKVDDEYMDDGFTSEIILECVPDDVIPIAAEQEVCFDDYIETDDAKIEVENEDIENQEIHTQEIDNQEIVKQEIDSQEIDNQEINNQEIDNVEIRNQEMDSQEIDNQQIHIHEIDNQENENQENKNQENQNQEENLEIEKAIGEMHLEKEIEEMQIVQETENMDEEEGEIYQIQKEIQKFDKEDREDQKGIKEYEEDSNEHEDETKVEIKSEIIPNNENDTKTKCEEMLSEDIKPIVKPETKKRVKTTPKKVSKTPKVKQTKKLSTKEQSASESVRRSSRIKSIQTVQKQKSSKGHGVVKHKEEVVEEAPPIEEKVVAQTEPVKFIVPPEPQKPVKVKSRWRRSCELELSSNLNQPKPITLPDPPTETKPNEEESLKKDADELQRRLKQFVHLKENLYLTERVSCKEAKKMTCDCFLTEEEIASGEYGCGEDCLNRLLMIECGSLCSVGDRCTNKKFQKGEFAPCEVFCTEKKGLGIRAAANIPYGEFILEYVGEVLDPEEFEKRATEYSTDKNQHYYFMALRADAVIDATQKGNISRFINHSCDPNAETQKWTVNGELRIGFFSKRTILAGEEITFDYQFQRYGKEAQKCFCEATTCRGWLGEEPEDDEDEDEEEDEEDEEEEEGEGQQELKPPDIPTDETLKPEEVIEKPEEKTEANEQQEQVVKEEKVVKKKEKKKVLRPRRMPRKDIFEDADLDEEIETLQTTGLKNQAQTLKLSRLMVRAKQPAQRTKLLRVLRHGEFPCRRLFLDYHGLRLIHGWMTDAQHMVKENKKLESQRLEILQTLATLPIPNKTMLQDSKVLPTVERWSKKIDESTLDSDSNSPKMEVDNDVKQETPEIENVPPTENIKTEEIKPSEITIVTEETQVSPLPTPEDKEMMDTKNLSQPEEPLPDYEVEIVALGLKLLDEWSVLKEVFRIPKKERIEQMKEHEREADRKYKAGLGLEQDLEKKYESRYGTIFKRKRKIFTTNDPKSKDDQMTVLEKYHRRKLFALQVEQQELERRRNQQEIWRQHEQRCMTMGTDPKFTAPFDPNQGLRNTMIWNPQISQWQNYPLPNTTAPNVYYPVPTPNLIPNQMPPPQTIFTGTQSIPINKLVQTPPPNIPNKPLYIPQQQPPPPQMMQYRPNVPVPMNYNVPAQNLAYPPPPQPDLSGFQNGKMIQPHIVVNKPPLPSLPYQENLQEDPSQVKFMGPIPPPVKLPPKWKCAKDKYGRPYYYHIRIRKAQWEPPELPPEDPNESSDVSSSDPSSLSSDSSSDDSDSDDEIDDARLLLQIKNKFRMMEANKFDKDGDVEMADAKSEDGKSLDSRLLEEFSFAKEEMVQPKKRRAGLVTEILISPRTEEDKLQFKEDVKRYKANKEKLKQQKEMLELSKRNLAGKSKSQPEKSSRPQKKHKSSVKAKLKEMTDSDTMKKIKESFRSSMAVVMVSILNPYRKLDCKEGRITNTDDFKHLARKLTHFVMLKELKHCQSIEDLTVTESVKSKAKEFVRKYMSKFGETYLKPKDDPEF